MKVHDQSTSGVGTIANDAEGFDYYVTDGAVVLNVENVAGARLYAVDGHVLAESLRSQVLPLNNARKGIYLLQVLTADGKSLVRKVVIR